MRSKAFAIATCGLVLALVGCHRTPRRRGPRPAVVVVHDGAMDEALSRVARSIDAELGGACPRRIQLGEIEPVASVESIARACVRGSGLSEPWTEGLVTVVATRHALDPTEGAAETMALRMIARSCLADGLGLEEAITDFDHAFEDEGLRRILRDDDVRGHRAIAFAAVEQLVARPGVGLRGALVFAREVGRVGLDAAFEAPPLHTNAETFFAVSRAAILSFPVPRPPMLVAVKPVEDGTFLAEFDRPLRPGAVDGLLCEVAVHGIIDGDVVRFPSVPESACLEVDGARVLELEIALTASAAPSGVDGALVRHSHMRALAVTKTP